MPLLTLHLIRVHVEMSSPALVRGARRSFVRTLVADASVNVIVVSEPRHVVLAPQHLDANALLSQPWDLLLLIQTDSASLPSSVQSKIAAEYKVCCGVSSKLLAGYAKRNEELRSKAPPPATGSLDKILGDDGKELSHGERLEVSPSLLEFMREFEEHGGRDTPMTMLNLLHFQPEGKASYHKYGQAFKEVAGKRGGDAKIVGNVVPPPANVEDARAGRAENEWWNEISIVHYPSIRSFCDMLAGDDYQEINERHRLGALKDTFLLCTTETLNIGAPKSSRL